MAESPRRLEWSARAGEDLAAIDAWYSQFGEATAERAVLSVLAAAQTLRHHPLLGPKGIKPGTRHKVVGEYPYTLVYRVAGSKVRLVRVLQEEMADCAVKPRRAPRGAK